MKYAINLALLLLLCNLQALGQRTVPIPDPGKDPRIYCEKLLGRSKHHAVRTTGATTHRRSQSLGQDRTAEVEAHLFLGNRARNAGDYEEANRQYGRALELNPNEWRARYGLGNVFSDQAALGGGSASLLKAIEQYKLALSLSARDAQKSAADLAELHSDLAQAHLRSGRPLAEKLPEALKEVRAALELNNRSASAVRRWGNVYFAEGNYDEAIKKYNDSLAIENSGATRVALGAAYWQKGNRDQALNEFKEAVRLMPDYVFGYTTLGDFYLRTESYQQAAAAFGEALELNPRLVEERVKLVISHYRANDRAAARREYENLRRLDARKADDLRRQLPGL